MDQPTGRGTRWRTGLWLLARWIVPLIGLVSLATGCASGVALWL